MAIVYWRFCLCGAYIYAMYLKGESIKHFSVIKDAKKDSMLYPYNLMCLLIL